MLKPGQRFAVYEWCMTDNYNARNAEHQRIKRDIEIGNGLPDIRTCKQVVAAMKKAGFEVLESEDLAEESQIEWYEPLDPGRFSLSGFRTTWLGRTLTRTMVSALELIHVAPQGSSTVSRILVSCVVRLPLLLPPAWLLGRRLPHPSPQPFDHRRRPAPMRSSRAARSGSSPPCSSWSAASRWRPRPLPPQAVGARGGRETQGKKHSPFVCTRSSWTVLLASLPHPFCQIHRVTHKRSQRAYLFFPQSLNLRYRSPGRPPSYLHLCCRRRSCGNPCPCRPLFSGSSYWLRQTIDTESTRKLKSLHDVPISAERGCRIRVVSECYRKQSTSGAIDSIRS